MKQLKCILLCTYLLILFCSCSNQPSTNSHLNWDKKYLSISEEDLISLLPDSLLNSNPTHVYLDNQGRLIILDQDFYLSVYDQKGKKQAGFGQLQKPGQMIIRYDKDLIKDFYCAPDYLYFIKVDPIGSDPSPYLFQSTYEGKVLDSLPLLVEGQAPPLAQDFYGGNLYVDEHEILLGATGLLEDLESADLIWAWDRKGNFKSVDYRSTEQVRERNTNFQEARVQFSFGKKEIWFFMTGDSILHGLDREKGEPRRLFLPTLPLKAPAHIPDSIREKLLDPYFASKHLRKYMPDQVSFFHQFNSFKIMELMLYEDQGEELPEEIRQLWILDEDQGSYWELPLPSGYIVKGYTYDGHLILSRFNREDRSHSLYRLNLIRILSEAQD